MTYREIFDELKEIETSDFNKEQFTNLCKLCRNIHFIYGKEFMDRKEDANSRYNTVYNRVNGVAFKKLKEKLKTDDKIINDLLLFMNYCEKVDDAYIIDDNAIVKTSGFIEEPSINQESIHFLLSEKMMNTTYKEFNDIDNNRFKRFFIESLNNAIKPLLAPNLHDSLIILENDKIKYNIPDLSIYLDHTLSKILSDNSGRIISKILVKYEDKIYSFYLRIHNGYMVIAESDNKALVLSEVLKEENDIKIKK